MSILRGNSRQRPGLLGWRQPKLPHRTLPLSHCRTISIRCGPDSAKATRISRASSSTVVSDTAGTPKPWAIFTQPIDGRSNSVTALAAGPGDVTPSRVSWLRRRCNSYWKR